MSLFGGVLCLLFSLKKKGDKEQEQLLLLLFIPSSVLCVVALLRLISHYSLHSLKFPCVFLSVSLDRNDNIVS
jgi:predicted membrane channel-forming protein YqfA (hemolysin III family)